MQLDAASIQFVNYDLTSTAILTSMFFICYIWESKNSDNILVSICFQQ